MGKETKNKIKKIKEKEVKMWSLVFNASPNCPRQRVGAIVNVLQLTVACSAGR
jgi:hypothetical protein